MKLHYKTAVQVFIKPFIEILKEQRTGESGKEFWAAFSKHLMLHVSNHSDHSIA
jgi:hypothetical protein